MSDLSEFLDVRVADVHKPAVLPTGMYKFVLLQYSLETQPNENKTKYVLATFKPVGVIESDEDVDLDDTVVKNVTTKFWRTPKADGIALRFLTETLGLEHDDDTTLGQLWEKAVGSEVIGAVVQRLGGKKKDRPFAEIDRFFPANSEAA